MWHSVLLVTLILPATVLAHSRPGHMALHSHQGRQAKRDCKRRQDVWGGKKATDHQNATSAQEHPTNVVAIQAASADIPSDATAGGRPNWQAGQWAQHQSQKDKVEATSQMSIASTNSLAAPETQTTQITITHTSSTVDTQPTTLTSIAPTTSDQPTSSAVTGGGGSDAGGGGGGTQDMVQLHNDFRLKYGAGNLTWNDELATFASDYAGKCVFEHSGGQYGENLAAGTGDYTIDSGFKAWADEAGSYVAGQYSHFTQVVWKDTTELGCAIVSCKDGTIFTGYGASAYVVCEYKPAGNVAGQFAANVQA